MVNFDPRQDLEQKNKGGINQGTGIVIGDRENCYRKIINTHSALNGKLSAKAVGFMFYFLSKKKGWKGQLYDLKKRFHIGDRSVQTGMKELVKFGYAELKSRQREHGQWKGKYYEIYSVPVRHKKVYVTPTYEKVTDEATLSGIYSELLIDRVIKPIYANN
jgi:hypothetical protein